MEKTTTTKKSWTTRAFLISLVALILCSLVNWGIITGWGNIKITRLTLVGDDGYANSALMYVPKNVNNENPGPGNIMYHGGSGNARNHESWAVEFARRGFVVISVDNLGSGNGEYNGRSNLTSPILFTQYMYDSPLVDNEKIIVAGHSIGGDYAQKMGLMFQPALTINSDGGGTVFNAEGNTLKGCYLAVGGGADKANPTEKFRNTNNEVFINDGVKTAEEPFSPGTVYGSFEDGNAHMLAEIPDQIHEGVFVNHAHIAAILDFSMKVIDAPNFIDPNNQIWHWKDVCGLIGMFLFVAFLCCLAVFLIDQVPFFASIKQPMPRNIGMRGKDLGISITCALLFPLLVLYTGAFGLVGFLGGARSVSTPIFRVRFAHIAVAIVLTLNLLGLVMFFVYHKVWGKKRFNATIRDYGLTSEGSTKIDWRLVGKSAFLGILVAAIGWTYLAIQRDTLCTDFYCLFFGFKDLYLRKFVYYIPYLVIWIPCFAIASVGMNVERRLPSTGKESLDTAIAVIFNGLLATATITIMVIVENAIQIHLGTSAVALSSWKTDITRIWGMPVGMFLGGAGNTYCYRKTGNIWLGAVLMGIVCCFAACLYGQTYPIGSFSIG